MFFYKNYTPQNILAGALATKVRVAPTNVISITVRHKSGETKAAAAHSADLSALLHAPLAS